MSPVRLDFDGTAPQEEADTTVTIPWLGEERRHAEENLRRYRREMRNPITRIRRRFFPRRLGAFRAHPEEATEIFRDMMQRALDSQDRAHEIVRDYRHHGLPFVLYLRNFEAETLVGLSNAAPNVGESDDLRQTAVMMSDPFTEGPTERALLVALDNLFPVVSLANSFGADLDSNLPGAHLMTSAAQWRSIAHELIVHAEAIVVRLAGITPGVEEELALIRDAEAVERAYIVLVDEPSQAHLSTMRELFESVNALELPPMRALSRDAPELVGFTVVDEGDLYIDDPPEMLRQIHECLAEVNALGMLEKLDRLYGRHQAAPSAHG